MMVKTFACLEKYDQGFFSSCKSSAKSVRNLAEYLKKTIVFLGRTYCFIEF